MGKMGKIKRGITEKFIKSRIKKRFEKADSETQWQLIKKLEHVYSLTGKIPTEKMIEKRRLAITELKQKGFLCSINSCENKAVDNGLCSEHGENENE